MIYGSVCSGIEAATQAWHPLGWKPAFFSEIEPSPSRILAHHYPNVPNLGDMTQFKTWPDYAIDILVGGTPCQSFSVAGLRKGLDDPRGNLMLTYGAIAARYRPRWLLWENVPGVLSSNEGRDFASLLGLLSGQSITVPENGWANAGIVSGYRNAYGLAWRVLDTQFVRTHRFPRAIPQRRRRVFLVGYIGDWHRAAAVLFDRESMSGNPPPRREQGKDVARTISARTKGGGGLGTDFELAGGLIAFDETQITSAANRSNPQPGDPCHTLAKGQRAPVICAGAAHTLKGEGFDASEDDTGRGIPLVCVHGTQDPCTSTDTAFALGRNNGGENVIAFSCKDHGADAGPVSPTLRSMGHDGSHANGGGQVAVAFALRGREDGALPEIHGDGDSVGALRAADGGSSRDYVHGKTAVRRLTEVECERLQGFPDGFTGIPKMKGGPRYKAIGNSMSVNAMEWIGERIAAVDEIKP